MTTVRELLRCADDLPGDSPRRDGEILLGHCLHKPRAWLYTWPDAVVEDRGAGHYRQLLAERRRGVPVAYLTGRREFWSLELAVDRHTLIPRPETETLVQWALELDLPERADILDLGTGSGAIALALARERPGWGVMAVDNSEAALQVARANARESGLERVCFRRSHWYRALGGERFHLVVGNPPYVDAADPHLARGDLRYEPRSALVAESGGLADLEAIICGGPAHLRRGGWLLLEHGFQQGAAVREMLRAAGLARVSTRHDLAGLERVSGGCLDAE